MRLLFQLCCGFVSDNGQLLCYLILRNAILYYIQWNVFCWEKLFCGNIGWWMKVGFGFTVMRDNIMAQVVYSSMNSLLRNAFVLENIMKSDHLKWLPGISFVCKFNISNELSGQFHLVLLVRNAYIWIIYERVKKFNSAFKIIFS